MGCHLTSISIRPCQELSDADNGRSSSYWTQSLLTNKQKTIIYNTWRHLSDDMVNTGIKVFYYVFLRQPHIQNLFTFRGLALTELPKNPYFRGHATHFMQAIAAAVDNLDDLDGKLTPLLLSLGQQHSETQGFGVEYFELFTHCLILVWEEKLADRFTPEVHASWEKLFVFILMMLREGYGNSHDMRVTPHDMHGDGRVDYRNVVNNKITSS